MPRPRTDTTRLLLPPGLLEAVAASSRDQAVVGQQIPSRAGWFAARAAEVGLPEAFADPGDARETRHLTRGDVFAAAEGATEDDQNAVRLVLHALAWGSGPFLRLNRQRIRALGTLWNERGRPGIGALRHSLRLAAEDPMAAYASMCPGGAARLMHLGPAFFTKVLYFAGAGATDHPSPILDRNVATALNRRCGWTSLGTDTGWPPATYLRYSQLLGRWAQDTTGPLGRPVAADELELALFADGRKMGRSGQQ
jgi:hypothetical protein